ncbi:MAG: sulfatase [Candidatus Aminicenantes bacterium]|nr:sulfatase [Candidatus Aminicenantes bacterium]
MRENKIDKILGFCLFVLLFFMFFLLPGCKGRSKRGNYILVTLDTQRADHLSCYDPENAQTPHFDFLASEGILYENCFSVTPITLPSHASLFFSQPPHQLRVYNNGHVVKEKRNRPSFVNIFKKKGYSTAAFVSLGVLESRFGLNEGFDLYDDQFSKGRWYLTAEEVNQKVFPWLEENSRKDFFLWIHYSDPHEPYYPPDSPPDLRIILNGQPVGEYNLNKTTYLVELDLEKGKNKLEFELEDNFINNRSLLRARFESLTLAELEDEKDIDFEFGEGWIFKKGNGAVFMEPEAAADITSLTEPKKAAFSFNGNILLPFEVQRENYRKDVEYMDKQFGELLNKLKKLGLMKNTHILVVGDHGESLGDFINYDGEPHFGHIFFLYDIYMRVPLIIYNPFSKKKGIRISEPVSLLDIAPTIMDTMGFNGLPHFKGKSMNSPREEREHFIFQETYKPQAIRNKFALLHYPFHLIYTPVSGKYELYDLESDPWERNNVYDEKSEEDQITPMKRILDDTVRRVIRDKIEVQVDTDTERMLKSLGYIK